MDSNLWISNVSSFLTRNVLTLTFVSLISITLIKDYWDPKRKRLPPGPIGVPFLGYIPFLPKEYGPKLKQLFARYGKILCLRLGAMDVVFISDFEIMKRVTKMDAFNYRPDFSLFSNFTVPTLANWNGEEWKEQWKFSLRILRDLGMGKQAFEDAILDEIDDLVAIIDKVDGEAITIHPYVGSSVSNVINHLVMGQRLSHGDPARQLIIDSFLRRGNGARPAMFGVLYYMPWLSTLLTKAPFSPARTFNDRFEKMVTYLRHRYSEMKSKFNTETGDVTCFMEAYLKEMSENKIGKYIDETHLVGNAFSFFAAGSNTTGDFLTWFFLTMIVEPEVQQKLRDEVDDIIGTNRPSLRHRERMPYTEAVIHELHRIASTTPSGIPRAVGEDVMLEGYFLPKGTQIIFAGFAIHSNPEYFEKPDEFIPERHISSDGKFVRNERITPFGLGKRSCPGEPIASTQIFLYITSMVQKFEFSAPQNRLYSTAGEMEFVGRIPTDSPIDVVFRKR